MLRFCWIALLLLAHVGSAHAQAGSVAPMPQPLLDQYAKAYAENWVQFGGGFHQTFFYLPRTIRVTGKGTKTVWGVNIQSIQGADTLGDYTSAREAITKQREEAGLAAVKLEKFATYLLTKIQWEVDCVHQRTRVIQFIDYDEEGNVLLFADIPGEKLEEPVPDTNGEGLLKAFCDPTHRNYFRDLLDGKPPKR